jgi:hypothetical protein
MKQADNTRRKRRRMMKRVGGLFPASLAIAPVLVANDRRRTMPVAGRPFSGIMLSLAQ